MAHRLSSRVLILALTALSAASYGQILSLANNGSTAQINAGTGTGGNQGLFDWRIAPGGLNFVTQQVYLFRVGTGAVATVNSISAPTISQPTADLATIGYASAASGFDLNFRYLLTGGPPASSDLAEIASLTNHGNTALTFSLFEYDFFTPGGSIGGTGTLLNSSTIRQVNGFGTVTVGATPIPDRWMIDTTGNVVNALVAGNLTNTGSPFTNANDLAFAFQWNVVVNPGQTWQMSKDKLITTPEPTSMIALAGMAAVLIRRRKSRKI